MEINTPWRDGASALYNLARNLNLLESYLSVIFHTETRKEQRSLHFLCHSITLRQGTLSFKSTFGQNKEITAPALAVTARRDLKRKLRGNVAIS